MVRARAQVTRRRRVTTPRPPGPPTALRIVYASDRSDGRTTRRARWRCDVPSRPLGDRRRRDRPGPAHHRPGERLAAGLGSGRPDRVRERPGWVAAGDFFGGELYVMNEDGSGVTRLTSTDEGESQPRWSPDGSMIAFVREEDGVFSLYVRSRGRLDRAKAGLGSPVDAQRASQICSRTSPGRRTATLIAFVSGGDAGNSALHRERRDRRGDHARSRTTSGSATRPGAPRSPKPNLTRRASRSGPMQDPGPLREARTRR